MILILQKCKCEIHTNYLTAADLHNIRCVFRSWESRLPQETALPPLHILNRIRFHFPSYQIITIINSVSLNNSVGNMEARRRCLHSLALASLYHLASQMIGNFRDYSTDHIKNAFLKSVLCKL